MKYVLTKISAPGWEKEFSNKLAARDRLYKHICNYCREDDSVGPNSPIEDMLSTACGCEFDFEEKQ